MFAAAKLGAVVVNVNTQWTLEQLSYVAEDCGAAGADRRAARRRARLRAAPLPASVARVLVMGERAGGRGLRRPARRRRPCPAADEVPRLDTRARGDHLHLGLDRPAQGRDAQPPQHPGRRALGRALPRAARGRPAAERAALQLRLRAQPADHHAADRRHGGPPAGRDGRPRLVAAAARHGVTGIAAVPPLWSQIVRLLDERPTPLPSRCGGSPTRAARSPQHPRTDAGGVSGRRHRPDVRPDRSRSARPICRRRSSRAKMGSIGRRSPAPRSTSSSPGEGIAGPGEQGELVHRGPLVSLGYWGRPEATAREDPALPRARAR